MLYRFLLQSHLHLFFMKKSFNILLPIFIIAVGLFSSCKKDAAKDPEPSPTVGLTKQASGYLAGAATKVELYTKETSIKTGYTKFYIAAYDSASGARIEDAHIHLEPIMDMGMMQHSAPYENPESSEAVDHLFPCSVVFIMPSTAGTWTLKMEIHNHQTDKEGTIEFPITVTDPLKATVKSFTAAHDGGKYFIALINPASPKVGINDFEFAVYKKLDMMEFMADNSLTATMYPEMPSMGHSSPNNVDPVNVGNGHYKGKVNFTMTGLWKVNLDFMSGAAVADSTQYFEIEF